MIRKFATATEAYNYIKAKMRAANDAGDLETAKKWADKITPKMRAAVRREQSFVIATMRNQRWDG